MPVTLDGSKSTGANGNLITYQWSIASGPAGSKATLSDSTIVNPTFTPDVAGNYVLNLQVSDDEGNTWTTPSAVTITVSKGNSAPVANAGPAQNVTVGKPITLSSASATDADDDKLTYRWTISPPAGSATQLSATEAVKPNPTFTPDLSGGYVLNLIANDGYLDSEVSTVRVTASKVNSIPVADAGANQNVLPGTVVTLDGGKSSDADGDLITYSWSFTSKPAGSSATLSDFTAANPTITPDVPGVYVLNLVVSDGKANSASVPVTITAARANGQPVANAGAQQNVTQGSLVTLDGSKSMDADGDLITYKWALVSAPAGSSAKLSNTTIVNPTFTADVAGTYVLSLAVNDGKVDSTTSIVVINAARGNSVPVASAGLGQNVQKGVVVVLDGSASSDANGDRLTYIWSFVSKPAGSAAILNNASSMTPSFTADVEGSYVLSLLVNDGQVNSAAATVTITASSTNAAPVANAGRPQSVAKGAAVTLDGGGSSDADGNSLTYSWNFTSKPSGSLAMLSAPTSAHPSFTADAAGSYVLNLVVNDGKVNSAVLSTVTITVTPPVLAYSAIPPQGVVSASSESFQADRVNELGSAVQLAEGAPRNLDSMNVVMASYGCETGSWSDGTCRTTPGTGFNWPITANIYAVDPTTGGQGELLARTTQTFKIAYRPSAGDSRCTDPNQFYNPGDGACHYSLPTTVTFNNFTSLTGGQPLPDKVIWTVTFNTQSAGFSPVGAACDGNNLNVGVGNLTGEPDAGTDLGMGKGVTANDTQVFMSYNQGYTGPPTQLQAVTTWPGGGAVHRPLGTIYTK